MIASVSQTLTAEERAHFIEHGYVAIRGAIPRDLAREAVRQRFLESGMDSTRPETWSVGKPLHPMKGSRAWRSADLAPRFWGAACDILGGAERIRGGDTHSINDSMTANLYVDEGKPWAEPDRRAGWHKDGYFFRHFLDSPEQALLALILWSDVVSRGGATYFAPQSVGAVARYLATHPEGVHPNGFPFRDLVDQCPTRLEAVGEAGDIYLMHGYMLHTVAPNPNRKLRCIANGIVALNEPMRFNREDPAEFSLLERAVLDALGADRLDFKPTRERLKTPDWSPLPPESK